MAGAAPRARHLSTCVMSLTVLAPRGCNATALRSSAQPAAVGLTHASGLRTRRAAASREASRLFPGVKLAVPASWLHAEFLCKTYACLFLSGRYRAAG